MMRLASIIGTLLALGGLGYLLWHAAPEMPAIDLGDPQVIGALALAMVAYVASQVFAAESWRLILGAFGLRPTARQARGQFLVSQIGKYVPGNVAHLFGRVVLARTDGLAALPVGAAMLIEVGVTLGLGLLIAGSTLLFWPAAMAPIIEGYPQLNSGLLTGALGGVMVAAFGMGAWMLRQRLTKTETPALKWRDLLGPAVLLVGSLSVLGLSLWAAIQTISPGAEVDVLTCTAVFTVAWIAGFVIPGAPGGIGIRDSVISLGLSAALGMGPALAVALVHRAVSVAGDVCTFALGLWLRKRSRNPKTSHLRPISAVDPR